MPAVFIVVAVGIAFAIVGGSGALAELGGSGSSTPLADDVSEEADVAENVEFDPSEGGGDSFLGSTVSTIRGVIGVVNLVLVFPATLEWFGVASYAAQPIGWGLSILFGMGIYQIVRGDKLR